MKIYDISQEILSCNVYPGDPSPKRTSILSVKNGDVCNLSLIEMCAHNGTHIDAPFHFIDSGKSVSEINMEKLVGYALVVEHNGRVTEKDAENFIFKARISDKKVNKILLKGKATVSIEAATVFAKGNIDLIGNESQTVGPEDAPMQVHLVLLNAEVVLLEGIRLSNVPEGVYLLNSAPLNISGADGSPCRAILIEI